jgi:hypothetical protein
MGSRAFCEGDELHAPTQLRRFQNRLGARSRLARLWGRFKMAARQPVARRTPPALQHARLAGYPVLSAPNSCGGRLLSLACFTAGSASDSGHQWGALRRHATGSHLA